MQAAAMMGGPAPLPQLGPWNRVFDSPDPGGVRRNQLMAALNMYVLDAKNRSAIVAREGFVGMHQQLGDVTSRTGKRSFLHRRLDGARDRYTFIGTKMYRWDGGTTYTDITPAGVTIDPTNRIFTSSYNNSLIVSDEVNPMWVYDAETATAETIWIDDARTAYTTKGGPVIYAGKVVFILRTYGGDSFLLEDGTPFLLEDDTPFTTEFQAGVQNTILWSEETQPTVGYVQTGYQNEWRLTQTSTETLGCLIAEEGALVYVRNTSIGYITGSISADFKASATKDTISNTVGSDCPASFVYVNKKIWFLDLNGLPYRMNAAPTEPEALDFPLRGVIEENLGEAGNMAAVALNGCVSYLKNYNLVLFTIFDRQTIYVFDADSGNYLGTWSIGGDAGAGVYVDAMDEMVDDQNRATILILGTRTSTYSTATQGVVWRIKNASDTKRWLDQADESAASYASVARRIDTHWLGSSAIAAYQATEVAASLLGDTAGHTTRLQYITPAGGISPVISATSKAIAAVNGKSNKAVTNAVWGVGRNAEGGSLRFVLSCANTDDVQWGVHSINVTGVVTKLRVGAA